METVALPDGREIPDYYAIDLQDFSLAFAVTDNDDVVFLRQYKHGVRRVCLTFPGGALNDGELPLAAAQRELYEETGYHSSFWTALGSFVTNSNQRCNVAHLFIAEHCTRTGPGSHPDVEAPEIMLIPRGQVWDRVSLDDVGVASHVALLALATHPALGRR